MIIHRASKFADQLATIAASGDSHEASWAVEFLRFLKDDPECFERSNAIGHFTGSGIVIDPYAWKILLTHHLKSGKWQQLGGHCDGIRDPYFVAWKECYEESGLKFIGSPGESIFQIHLHETPTYQDVPAHLHYDVRYLFTADSTEPFVVSEESLDLAWVDLGKVSDYTKSRSMLQIEHLVIQTLTQGDPELLPEGYVPYSEAA